MKLRTAISIAALGLCLGGVAPAFAEPARNFDVTVHNSAPLLLASRNAERVDPEFRGNERDRAESRGNGDNRRQQNETQRDERASGFGYGFERRQERGERATERRNGRE